MDIRKRIHGPCGARLPTMNEMDFDIGLFLRRLLLFDTYILDTMRFMEFPHLVKFLGYDAVLEILKSDFFKIDCNPTALAEVSQLKASKSPRRKGETKLGSFSFANAYSANRKDYISDCLNCISSIEGITFKEKKRLKRQLVDSLVPIPGNFGSEAILNFRRDVIDNHPVVKSAIVCQIKKERNLIIGEDDFNLYFSRSNEIEDEFNSETNLDEIIKSDKAAVHNILQGALLGAGRLNYRIENMKNHNALSGFKDEDLPLFEKKLSFLERLISPNTPQEQFQRVITIADLPDFSDIKHGARLNIDKFIKVRASKECNEFRDWLSTIETTTDKEIKDRVLGLKAKVTSAIHSPSGGVLRFLVSSTLGLAGVGEIVNLGLGALDHFLLDKIVPKAGIATFIHKLYPSLFQE